MKQILQVKNLSAFSSNKAILKSLSFSLESGKNLVILGQNGAGKSTLAKTIAGCSNLNIDGEIIFDRNNITKKNSTQRSLDGIFLTFQTPPTIEGLTTSELIRTALEVRGKRMSLKDFKLELAQNAEKLNINPLLAERDLSSALSGGERKKLEMLQILTLKPKLIIFDEIDSGLDINSVKEISQAIANYQQETGASAIIVTHTFKILKSIQVDSVLLLDSGAISKIGDKSLLAEVQQEGFK